MLRLSTLTRQVTVLALSAVFAAVAMSAPVVLADGKDSTDACLDTTTNVHGSVTGTGNQVTKDVGAGNVVTGVCIKSGDDSFEDEKHSGVITSDGLVEGCYNVAGIGTQSVTVQKNATGEGCKDISHIDVLFDKKDCDCENPEEPEVPETPVTPQTPTTPQVLGTQTTAPQGGVAAGAGPVTAGSLMGLSASISGLAYGIRRLRKND